MKNGVFKAFIGVKNFLRNHWPTVFISVIFFIRILLVVSKYGENTGDYLGMLQGVIRSDLYLFGILILMCYTEKRITRKLIKIPIRITTFFIVFLYFIDVAVFKLFHYRLKYDDFMLFFSEVTGIKSILGVIMDTRRGIFLVCFTGCALLYSVRHIFHKKTLIANQSKRVLVLASFLIATRVLIPDVKFVNAWVYNNYIENNLSSGKNVKYSDEYIQDLTEKYKNQQFKTTATNQNVIRKNVILVLVESLSSYHSQFFSGLNDYTPGIDKLAQKGLAFTNFYANGFRTEDGLGSILTGEYPMPSTSRIYSSIMDHERHEGAFEGFFGGEKTITRILKKYGHHTMFLTSGDLSFTDKITWLKSIGFDFIEGHDSEAYRGVERFHFESAPDQYLYDRAFSKIGEIGDKPFFLMLETVSTHLPYINPITGETSEESAFGYADAELYKFYEKLVETGFFENGLLIITSDHRAMTPVSNAEYDLFGESAICRVPLVILDGDKNNVRKIRQRFQQADFIKTIELLYDGQTEITKFKGAITSGGEFAPEYILHCPGYDRSSVLVFNHQRYGKILLNGDNTKLETGDIKEIQKVIETINYLRIKKIGPLENRSTK